MTIFTSLKTFLLTIHTQIDLFVQSNSFLRKNLVNFFDYSSRLTHIIFIDLRGFLLFTGLIFTIYYFSLKKIAKAIHNLPEYEFNRETVLDIWSTCVPLNVKVFLIILYLLFQLISFNTFISTLPTI